MASSEGIQPQHLFLAIHSADEHRMIYSFSNTTFYSTCLRFLFFFWDNMMADVASKQQTTALVLSTIVTIQLTKNLTNLCYARNIQFKFS
jgi:hypothetical protein